MLTKYRYLYVVGMGSQPLFAYLDALKRLAAHKVRAEEVASQYAMQQDGNHCYHLVAEVLREGEQEH